MLILLKKIGNFKIISESSISAGVRRIEAITDKKADEYLQSKLDEIAAISSLLKNPENILDAVRNLQQKNIELSKEIDQLSLLKLKDIKASLKAQIKEDDGFSFIHEHLEISAEEMKKLAFELKGEVKSFVLLLTSGFDKKPLITLMISENLVAEKNWNASSIIRELAKEIKGGGGGQPFLLQLVDLMQMV